MNMTDDIGPRRICPPLPTQASACAHMADRSAESLSLPWSFFSLTPTYATLCSLRILPLDCLARAKVPLRSHELVWTGEIEHSGSDGLERTRTPVPGVRLAQRDGFRCPASAAAPVPLSGSQTVSPVSGSLAPPGPHPRSCPAGRGRLVPDVVGLPVAGQHGVGDGLLQVLPLLPQGLLEVVFQGLYHVAQEKDSPGQVLTLWEEK